MSLRSCAGCGAVGEKGGLVRLTWGANELELDLNQRMGGRGVYLCNIGVCLDKAAKRGQLSFRLRKDLGPMDSQALRQQMTKEMQRVLLGIIKQAKLTNKFRVVTRSDSVDLKPGSEVVALISGGASINRMRRIMRFCRNRGLPFGIAGDREQFHRISGKSSCSLVILEDGPAAKKARDLLLGLGQLSGG